MKKLILSMLLVVYIILMFWLYFQWNELSKGTEIENKKGSIQIITLDGRDNPKQFTTERKLRKEKRYAEWVKAIETATGR